VDDWKDTAAFLGGLALLALAVYAGASLLVWAEKPCDCRDCPAIKADPEVE
jgi:hypothetical protein